MKRERIRVREKTTSGFHIPSSGHLRSLLGRKILELALLVLRFYSRGSSEPGAESGREKPEVIPSRTLNLFVDCTFLGSSLLVFATGMVLLLRFHVADGAWQTDAFGIERLYWLNLHRLTALLLAAAMIAHVAFHLRSFIVKLIRPGKRKSETAMVLTFFVVVVTGYVIWFCVDGSSRLSGPVIIGPLPIVRHIWVDLHHFSGLAALPLSVLHTVRRFGWMKRNLRAFFNRPSVSKTPT